MLRQPQRFRHLFHVDVGPGPSRRGIRRALDTAHAFDARLSILGAFTDPSPSHVVRREHASAWEQRLGDHVRELDREGRVDWVDTLLDASVDEVLAVIERRGADLVLAPGRERSGFTLPWTRTPLRDLMRKASCPVWVLHPGQLREVESVLAAVDVADGRSLELARRVVECAVETSSAFGAQLTLVHAWALVGSGRLTHPLTPLRSARLGSVRRKLRDGRKLRLLELMEGLDLPENVQVVLRRGTATDVLRREVARREVDAVVLGHSARTGLGRFVPGDLSDLLLGTVPASLLVVHLDDLALRDTHRELTHGEA